MTSLFLNCSELALTPWTGTHRYVFNVARGLARLASQRQQLVHVGFGVNGRLDASLDSSPMRESLQSLLGESSVRPWAASGRRAYHVGLPWALWRRGAGVYYKMSGGLRATLPLPCPQVALVHDCFRFTMPEAFGVRDSAAERAAARRVLARCSRVICVSSHTRSQVIGLFGIDPARVGVAYCGATPRANVDDGSAGGGEPRESCEVVDPESGQATQYLLMVNAGRGNKNWEDLVAAFGILASESVHADLRLIIAGVLGDQADAIRAWREANPSIANRVETPGYVDDAKLAALYAGSTCVVVPSRFEGFGMPVIEAMAHGKPVVCSNIAVFYEVAGDAALRFAIGDAEALAGQIGQVLRRSDVRERLRKDGLRRAAEFTWERAVQQTLRILDEAAASP